MMKEIIYIQYYKKYKKFIIRYVDNSEQVRNEVSVDDLLPHEIDFCRTAPNYYDYGDIRSWSKGR